MPLDANPPGDELARETALTAIDRTLLVEAGAGSGKTSVLAGRVAVLLASGRHPSSIAAISFTEFTAAELRERIVRFVDELLAGRVPQDLRAAFPNGKPTAEQRANLEGASKDLDCLTCLTIHGFCRVLLTPYPVEAGIDPGAAMLDQDAADLLFEDECTAWLRERLSGEFCPDDVFAALYVAEPRSTTEMLRTLAKAICGRRDASVEEHITGVDTELAELGRAVSNFRAFLTERGSGKHPEALAAVAFGFENQLAAAPAVIEAEMLPWLVRLRAPGACAIANGSFTAPSKISSKKSWKEILGGGKGTEALVNELNERTTSLYAACRDAHEAMRAAGAGRILHLLAGEARKVLIRYDAAKRNAAALDFDDLLLKAKVLLASQPEVRTELALRFPTVLVDEFQDTDPTQLEILWRLCGDPPKSDFGVGWREWTLRPGALFLVGDPKQSIYRFRSADLGSFIEARELLRKVEPESILAISRNFRSRPCILNWVNKRFEECLSVEGQAGFVDLTADEEDPLTTPGVAALDLDCEGTSAQGTRDIEAEEVAKLCLRLVGNVTVRDREAEGGLRPCEPRDIALLVPTNTDLWRYERALEESGFTVATQAGKGFYRRQEVQDLIALARALADDRDRLALGALLRGPLVGFPDEVLLDAVAAQPPLLNAAGQALPAQISLHMNPLHVPDPLLRATLEKLRSLARQRRTCTPHILLCRAVEAMNVRAILRQRGGRVAELALANVDLFLEMTRPYDVRGIRAFAERMRERWEEAEKSPDARPDADLRSISLVTMHSGKGLEWPVVIPVNTASLAVETVAIAYDPRRKRIHMPVYGLYPNGCEEAVEFERQEQRFERQRLWYVAMTRPRDLLMIPRPSCGANARAWAKLVNLDLDVLHPFGVDFPPANIPLPESSENFQDRATFEAEADRIQAAEPHLKRKTPHLAEGSETGDAPTVFAEDFGTAYMPSTRGSLARGLVLHKLLEEVLTGETADARDALAARGAVLLGQFALPVDGMDPGEMADTVLRGLSVPEIATVRHRLVPEWPVAACDWLRGEETITLGVADAIALEMDGTCSLVVDWKSDLAPSEQDVARYRGQVREYLAASGAPEGLLVFLSPAPPVVVRVGPQPLLPSSHYSLQDR